MAQYAGHSPYGEIFTTNTSAVDNIAKRIYAEKQQRDLLQRQEGKMLDDEFGKNLAKVKSADIPEITQAYNEFKQKHIALQKKGNKVTPQDQMELMMSKANVNEKINGSVQDKDYLKLRADEGKADKRGRYKPNFNIVIQNELNRPTSQRNRDNDDALLLNQYSFPDLEKVSANMIGGKPTEIKLPTGQKSVKGDLYDDENVYQRFNHPNKMYENAYLDVSKRADRDAYENIVLNSLNDKEKEDLKTRYFAKVNSPEFKAIYGEVQPFPESAGQTELGQAVALSVMSAVDKLPIQPLRTESKLNSEAAMDKKRKEGMEDWKIKQQISDQYKSARIRLNNAGRTYEIENVPLKLKQNITTLPSSFGYNIGEVVDVTNWSDAELDDVLGNDKNKFGMRKNSPIEIGDKKYLKVTPTGFMFNNPAGELISVNDDDVIVNTDRRKRGLDKPVGQGKAIIQNNAGKDNKPKKAILD